MVFKLITFIVFFNSSLVLAAASDWNKSEMDESKIWIHKKNSDITGTILTIKRDGPLNWNDINKSSFYQRLEESKKRSLGIIGIHEWKASHYKFETVNGVERLMIEGTYVDSSGLEVLFKEIHVFQAQKTIQLLHTRPKALQTEKKYEEDFFSFALAEVDK